MSDDRPVLLAIEDDRGLQTQMRWALDRWHVVFAATRDEALALLRRHAPAVVTLDLGLPPTPDTPETGLRLLPEILAMAPATKVIALTGQNARAHAVQAIALGAHDFYAKPFEAAVLATIVERAFHVAALERESRTRDTGADAEPLPGLLSRDEGMRALARRVERIAPADATVLVLGESGTGKELVARALHERSPRRRHRFVAINCAAIPDTLLEAELFGHEKGAFTGAVRQTPGRFELADRGTLFLDEIGDLPLALQAKLLRFLQERCVERLGGRDPVRVDVRVVGATHRDLRALVRSGAFREDLWYRLAEVTLSIPPLRDRPGDALLMAHAFLRRFCEANGRDRLVLAPDAAEAIERHGWPGNVRELENTIKRAVLLADGPRIHATDLGLEAGAQAPHAPINLRELREAAERAAVVRALGHTDGNVARAAELLGISRPTLYDLMNRFALRRSGDTQPGLETPA